jgi:hypothetical protein
VVLLTLRPRAIAWTLVLAGVALGWQPAFPAEPRRVGNDIVLAGDFHVHSFPGDGALPPWDLSVEAARRGLDVIGLTNHNHRVSIWLARLLGAPAAGALIVEGEELTAVGYHMAAIGASSNVTWRQTPAAAAAQIHERGGVAIAAHPAGNRAKVYRRYDDAALDAVDGVEVAHPMRHVKPEYQSDLEAFYARAQARHPGIAAIGSTDFHFFAPIGVCRTYLFARERSVSGVLDAIRRGRTVACDTKSGDTYGPPDLAAVVAGACRAAGTSGPRGDGWRDRAGAICVWLGLSLLVAFGARERGLE